MHIGAYVGILFNTFALTLYFCYILFGASYFMLCSHSSVSHCRVPYMENSGRCDAPPPPVVAIVTAVGCCDVGAGVSIGAASHRRRRLKYNNNQMKTLKCLRSICKAFSPHRYDFPLWIERTSFEWDM